MTRSFRAHVTVATAALFSVLALGMTQASAASAFSESYGFFEVGNGADVQSAGAHTFWWNNGAANKSGTLACQLFNHSGANVVEHGNGGCTVTYFGGEFVWARVYNQTGGPEVIGGEAGT
jgi:hypothetical protein